MAVNTRGRQAKKGNFFPWSFKGLKRSNDLNHQGPHKYKLTCSFKSLIQLSYLICTIYLLCSRLLYSQVNLIVQGPHTYKVTCRFKSLIQLRYLIRTIYLLCSRLLYSQVNLTVQVIPTINMPPTVYRAFLRCLRVNELISI